MKKLIIILALLTGLSNYSSAQGNLQFNQVILVNFNATIGSWTNTSATTITVPAGKVWKIEHADAWVNTSLRQTNFGYYSLFVDNIILKHNRGSTGSNNQFTENFPVWLPAGTYTVYISNEDSSVHTYYGTINALEFNVVP